MIVLEVVTIIVVVYVIGSFATFGWMLWQYRHAKIPSRISNNHPELQSVRRSEELLVFRAKDPGR
jgi:predicted negative regulator of RcsB-dependent stress response